MTKALVIARLTLMESLRRQIYLVTLFLGVIICVVPAVVNVFGLGASERVVKDVSLTLIGYYGVLLSLLFGATAVPGEVERKTIYPLLTRPMPRSEYLWGKWLGLMAFVTVSLVFLLLCLIGASAYFLRSTDVRVVEALVCYAAEAGVLLAVCIFFSTFTSPPLAGVLAAFVYIVGGLPSTFIDFFLSSDVLSSTLARGLKLVSPHFQFFHVKDAVVHGDFLPPLYLLTVILYGAAWVVMAQLLAEWVFERRDL